jgi:cellulose synthase (UDP-forming)
MSNSFYTINQNKILNNYKQMPHVVFHMFMAVCIIYLLWWMDIRHAGNIYLYILLALGEVYHVFQVLTFAFTVYDLKIPPFKKIRGYYPVDVFITVCGEPEHIVEKTVIAAVNMNYPNLKIYVLNDGKIANKENWQRINEMAVRNGAIALTRHKPGGFKAGNINNALKITNAPFFAIFDADHVPEKDFLQRTMGQFSDKKLALVQTPQYYSNHDENEVTAGAWEQQELFFGPILIGKNRNNAAFWCGTNAIIRKKALMEIGGVPDNNIAEDFLSSMFLHEKGWKTLYIPEILAKGLAPFNLGDYATQQFRWARGSLEVIFKYNILFRKNLTIQQKIHYLASASYYMGGLIVIIDATLPLLFMFFNVQTVSAAYTDFILFFFPFIIFTVYILSVSSKQSLTFRAVKLSFSTFWIFTVAAMSTLFRKKVKFNVTPKQQQKGNFLLFAVPHLLYVLLSIVGTVFAIYTRGLSPEIINNASWLVFNIVFMSGFIAISYPWSTLFNPVLKPAVKSVYEPAKSTIVEIINVKENKDADFPEVFQNYNLFLSKGGESDKKEEE